jgi:hypothetical protein
MVAFDAYLDAGRLGKVVEDLRWLALGTVGEDICGQVDFMFSVDQRHVDVL